MGKGIGAIVGGIAGVSAGTISNSSVDADITAGTNDNNDVFLQALSSGPQGAPNLNSSGNWQAQRFR